MKTLKIKYLLPLFLIGACLAQSGEASAADKLRVVTTTNTLASLTKEILGDTADIHHVASPSQNIHFIQPTPKDVLKMKKARVLIHQGLDLEAWRDPLIVASANPLFIGDAKGAIDVSKGVALVEAPASLSRAGGDIHAYGNPHYAIDPENAKIIMQNIVEGLFEMFPERANEFKQKGDTWQAKIDDKMKEWQNRMAPYQGANVVTYHKSWPYFLNRFGFVTIGELEPKPGIPPTPKHISELIKEMKEKNVRLIIREEFNEAGTPRKLSQETGVPVVTLLQDVGEAKDSTDYISTIEHNIHLIEEALTKKETK